MSKQCTSNKCGRLFCLEFHYSKLWFFHRDWRAFTYTPWTPYKWYFQLPYLIYRWILAIFFFVWLILTGLASDSQYLAFLTNWSFVIFNLHLVWSAVTTTYQYFKAFVFCAKSHEDTHSRGPSDFAIEAPKGCCGAQSNGVQWYHMIQWILFTIGTDMALVVTILFWTVLYDPSFEIDGPVILPHLINGIIALVEIWVTGLPVHFLHFIYVQIFGATYATFTGIYFAANLTNTYNGERYIYPVLDYEENPVSASLTCVLVALLVAPAVHFVFYIQYVMRYWLVYCIYGRQSKVNSDLEKTEMVDIESNDQ